MLDNEIQTWEDEGGAIVSPTPSREELKAQYQERLRTSERMLAPYGRCLCGAAFNEAGYCTRYSPDVDARR